MTLRIHDRDRGKSGIVAALEMLERGQKVTVGVHEDVGAQAHRGGSGATVAEVAAFAELGTEHEAPKAYLRGVIDADRTRLEQGLARAGALAVKNAGRGMEPRQAIEDAVQRVGDRAAASVRRRVRQLGLRDTGHLEESVEARLAKESA